MFEYVANFTQCQSLNGTKCYCYENLYDQMRKVKTECATRDLVFKTEKQMDQNWKRCKAAFGKCKKEQDKSIPFISKCKTSMIDLIKQYEVLTEVDDALKKVEWKIRNVTTDSESSVKVSEKRSKRSSNEELEGLVKERGARATIIYIQCSVFSSSVLTVTQLTQNVGTSRAEAAVKNIVVKVSYIMSVTVFPACQSSEISALTTILTTVVTQRAVIATQIARVNTIVKVQTEATIQEVVEQAGILNLASVAHEPPHIGNQAIADILEAGETIRTCTSYTDCGSCEQCTDNMCRPCSDSQTCENKVCGDPECSAAADCEANKCFDCVNSKCVSTCTGTQVCQNSACVEPQCSAATDCEANKCLNCVNAKCVSTCTGTQV